MDYLHCSPRFNEEEQHDFVITSLPQKRTYAQLIFTLVCWVGGLAYHLAIILPLDKVSRASTRSVDNELSIHQWQIRSRTRCEVVPLDCIVRGAVLVKDPNYSGDYFVLDTLDEDMFL